MDRRFPGATLAILVLAVNLLGDWLRDALNPLKRCSRLFGRLSVMSEPVISVRNLRVEFATRRGSSRD